ncbi:Integrase catalytic domain-containing protein [Burkholderia multivorans]
MDADTSDVVCEKQEKISPPLILSPHGLYVQIGSGGKQEVYRYLCRDASTVWMMQIGEQKKDGFELKDPPKTLKLRKSWTVAYVRHQVKINRLNYIADARGIPCQMPTEDIPDGVDPELDMRRKLVKYITDTWGDRVITEHTAYSEAIYQACDMYGVSPPSARKWLEMHLFYGGHSNATMTQHWRKGAKHSPRRGLRDERGKYVANLGRPTANERLDPNTPHKRKRLYQPLFQAWLKFINVQAWENDDPLTVILDRFKGTRVGFNRAPDGTVVAYPVDPKYMPEDANMLRVGRPVLKKARFERDEARRKDANRRRRELSGGSSRDLVDGPLSVLDIDATPADIYLRYGNETIFIDGEGRPTIYIAIDRGSNAVVGWYVTFGTENGDGYKNCLFSAFTPKEREVRKWGLPHMDGLVYGCTSQVFLDRGPGISKKTLTAVAARLCIDALMAEPGKPEAKGLVERIMRYVQDEVARIPGSKRPLGNADDDRLRQKNAKEVAIILLAPFMRAFITGLNRWNLECDARHLLTADMIENGNVLPRPADIYRYNKAIRTGAYEWDWPEEKIFLNLCEKFERAAPDGIVTVGSRSYSSDNLKAVSRKYLVDNPRNRKSKNYVATVYEIPNAPMHLLWLQDDGTFECLDAHGDTKKNFNDDFRGVHDFLTLVRNAKDRVARFRSRKIPRVSTVINKGVVSKAKQKKIDDIEKHAHLVDNEETATEKRKKATHVAEKDRVEDIVGAFNRDRGEVSQDMEAVEDEDFEFSSVDNFQRLRLDF